MPRTFTVEELRRMNQEYEELACDLPSPRLLEIREGRCFQMGFGKHRDRRAFQRQAQQRKGNP